jgi:cell division protein FtsQ
LAWIVVGLAGIGLTGWGAAEVYRHAQPYVRHWFEVREVTISGAGQVTRQDVLDRLALQSGETLLSVGATQLVGRLETHPWIKQAKVSRAFPHTLEVTITERQPAAVLRTLSVNLLLDGEGTVLPSLAEAEDPGLPVLLGIDPQGLLQRDAQLRQVAQAGIQLAGLLDDEFDGRPEVDMSDPDNAIAYVQGLRFQFGSSSFEEKWERYRKITTHCTDHPLREARPWVPGNGCPALHVSAGDRENEIDLRYPGKVIVRERG